MKALSLIIIFVLLLTPSCSKNESSEKASKSNAKAKFRTNTPQEAPPRQVIDINEEGYSVDAILKIDKEIPILEIIVGKNWKQAELDKLQKMQMLDTLRLENMDSSSFDLSFAKSIKSLKVISFKGGQTSIDTLKSLAGSNIQTVNCTATNISKDSLEVIKSSLGEVTVSF